MALPHGISCKADTEGLGFRTGTLALSCKPVFCVEDLVGIKRAKIRKDRIQEFHLQLLVVGRHSHVNDIS
jgi:hypothetical protein